MCSGRDIVQGAAIGLGVYAGGAAAGLWGTGAGATGAVAGSEAFANTVGAAGGDALGSLIASNAPAWGVSVAPEIAALGAGAAGAGAAGAGAAGAGAAPAGAAPAGAAGALQTAAQLAPLASLVTLAGVGRPQPAMLGTPVAAPRAQAAQTPAPNIFKKRLSVLGDPTKVSGAGGVTDLTLGKATVLGR